MNSANKYIEKKLTERKESGSYRSLKAENKLIDFCSNDYLGFARSEELKELLSAELDQHPELLNGSTGSRLLSGNTVYMEDVERSIAQFHSAEAALIFNSGYDANLGLFSSLAQRGDTIITDELIHASIIDGTRLSNANRYTFLHNDLESLEAKLKVSKGTIYVAIESVYSMDGDTSPIEAILKLTEKYNANLIVDEAHAVGLHKKGLVCKLGLQDRVFARVITFGKALGCHGAAVLGSNLLNDYLINYARSFIYTTAAAPHQFASIKAAYELLENTDNVIDKLNKSIGLFKQYIKTNSTYSLLESDSVIQCIIFGSNEKARAMADHLQNAGLDVRPILSPTVAQGSERIRICLHAFNTEEEIILLTDTINNYINAQ